MKPSFPDVISDFCRYWRSPRFGSRLGDDILGLISMFLLCIGFMGMTQRDASGNVIKLNVTSHISGPASNFSRPLFFLYNLYSDA